MLAVIATLIVIAVLWVSIVLVFADPLCRRWREPVFKQPILIIESDDWGAGPPEQAGVLNDVIKLLKGLQNRLGEHPIMTIGLVLEVADREAMLQPAVPTYRAITLADRSQASILDALRAGMMDQVIFIQAHGCCHYWPATLMALRESDARVTTWFNEGGIGWTETLPDAVQSRWTDGRRLPSHAHPIAEIESAVQSELYTWRSLFNEGPTVAVPNTFIWNADVERSWAAAGVETIVTPGCRFVGRDAAGKPGRADRQIFNGEHGESGLIYLVRDVYFEPAKGHTPARLLEDLQQRFRLGRPALVETHRFNFCGPWRDLSAFATFEGALRRVIAEIPAVRFMSTAALAQIIVAGDSNWIERRLRRRIAAWLRRIREIPRFRKLAIATGLALPFWILEIAAA